MLAEIGPSTLASLQNHHSMPWDSSASVCSKLSHLSNHDAPRTTYSRHFSLCLPQLQLAGLPQYPWCCMCPHQPQPTCQSYLAYAATQKSHLYKSTPSRLEEADVSPNSQKQTQKVKQNKETEKRVPNERTRKISEKTLMKQR